MEIRKPVLMVNLDSDMYKSVLEFVVAEETHRGNRVHILGCRGGFFRCIPKQAIFNGSESNTCLECHKAQLSAKENVLRKEFSLNEPSLFDTDLHHILNFIQNNALSSQLVRDFRYRNIPIFRLLGFDFIMNTRILNLNLTRAGLSDHLRDELDYRIVDIVRAVNWVMNEIEISKFSSVIACNGNYMLNGVLREYALQHKIPFYSVEIGIFSNSGRLRYRYLEGRDAIGASHYSFENYLGISFKLTNFSKIIKEFGNRFRGLAPNAYTTLEEYSKTLDEIRIFRNNFVEIKTVFLSSSEEILAHLYAFGGDEAYSEVADIQIDFLKHVINKANQFPTTGVIVRIHPRQGISKRSKVLSEEYVRICELVATFDLPANVLIIYAEDPISSYKLIAISDSVYVFWSSIGLESILLGVPTLSLYPELTLWPIKDLTKNPFLSSVEAINCFFQNSSERGLPLTEKLIGWIERGFLGNWYKTCLPLVTPSNRFDVENLFWRTVSKLNLKNILFKFWIISHSPVVVRDFAFTRKRSWRKLERLLLTVAKWRFRKWQKAWLEILISDFKSETSAR